MVVERPVEICWMNVIKAAPSDALWVITPFYNPVGYRRRFENFKAFRRHLVAPLLVVELAREGRHCLADDDADIVLRLTGEDRIWQKERLINLGTAALPDHVRYVAWADCDLILSDPAWPAKVRAKLDANGGMTQLFNQAFHLPQEVDPQTADLAVCANAKPILSALSIAHALESGRFDKNEEDWRRKRKQAPGSAVFQDFYHCYGFAWAAKRETLARCGLYEGNAVGGGDALKVFAALERIDEYWTTRNCGTDAHKAHFLLWAQKAREAGLFDAIGDIAQNAYHLWHGAIANRQYGARYDILTRNDFDPARDLSAEDAEVLRWTRPDSALAREVGEFFVLRREDG